MSAYHHLLRPQCVEPLLQPSKLCLRNISGKLQRPPFVVYRNLYKQLGLILLPSQQLLFHVPSHCHVHSRLLICVSCLPSKVVLGDLRPNVLKIAKGAYCPSKLLLQYLELFPPAITIGSLATPQDAGLCDELLACVDLLKTMTCLLFPIRQCPPRS